MPCEVTDNLARAHWEKLIWNVPFNGLGVAGAAGFDFFVAPPDRKPPLRVGGCLATDTLLADARWERLVRELMIEVITIASALGFPLREARADEQISRTRTMGAYRASTLIDFERGQPLEIDGLFEEPLRQARAAGVAAPRLATLCDVLRRLEAGRTP